jgi:hypothetical protein
MSEYDLSLYESYEMTKNAIDEFNRKKIRCKNIIASEAEL